MKKLITIKKTSLLATLLIITLLLSSCALLDRLRGVASPHADVLITVPVVDKEILEVPIVTEDIRG